VQANHESRHPTASQATFKEDISRVRWKVAFELLGDELRVYAVVGPRADPELILESFTQLDHRVRDLLQRLWWGVGRREVPPCRRTAVRHGLGVCQLGGYESSILDSDARSWLCSRGATVMVLCRVLALGW
jgi:hypothetical protein